jgi:D-glycero-D-manno-heptose 1,7-bisphosphate phosphatase
MHPAVFLDRDGTIIEEVGYLNRLDRLAFFPWTIDAIRALNGTGLLVVVVTNQAGVALGYFDEAFVRHTHRHMDERIRAGRARVDGYYYCPHHPRGTVEVYRQACDCRKPGIGMLRQAAADLGIDVARSYVVGDRWGDVELGRAAGAKAILLNTGYASRDEARPDGRAVPDHVSDNLSSAAGWIIGDLRRAAAALDGRSRPAANAG